MFTFVWKMEIFPFFLCTFFILSITGLVQTKVVSVGGNFNKEITSSILTRTTKESLRLPEPPIQASTCPPNSTISPCICSTSSARLEIMCSGSAVDQASIENVFREIRQVNGIPGDRGVDMDGFTLNTTELTHLDLAPFCGSRLDHLYMRYNYNLTTLVTSAGNYGSIHARRFDILHSHINRGGFGDTLKYFSNEMTIFYAYDLPLNQNNNNTGKSESEFLPGLSALTNLQSFYLTNCSISGRLNSDTWIPKELKNLQYIDFGSNDINEIGENVFDGVDDVLIFFNVNKLNESSFHPNSGIARSGRRTGLYLFSNQITTLASEIFQTFLDAHPQNALQLYENPLICDERLSWIKSRRDEFQERVYSPDCVNDPGHTLFDSDLIPVL